MVLSVGTGEGNVDKSDAYFITFGVGHLVCQVFVPTERTTRGIQFERYGNRGIIKLLWPGVFSPLVWPQPQAK